MTHAIIYHLTSPDAWQRAQDDGQLTAPSLDAEGFLHASTRHQLCATADRYYADADALIAVAIDADALQDILQFEPPHPPSLATQGQLFPHIYGAVPLDAILAAVALDKNPQGHYILSDNLP